MSIAWRLDVLAFDGTGARPTIDLDDAVASLDTFSVDGAGSCIEATFTAKPSAIDVRPRDVVTLSVTTDGTTYEAVFRGFVAAAPSARSNRLSPYRLVGLRQRFYEHLTVVNVTSGADVATMAHEVADRVDQNILGASLPASFPALTFELGDRVGPTETVGDLLDALAASVGSFTVPTGETYTYNGVTYTAGQVVPGVRWGVDGSGLVFFHRPQGTARAFTETARSVDVEWAAINAESVLDRIALVYGTAWNGTPVLVDSSLQVIPDPTPLPLVARAGYGLSGFGDGTSYNAARAVHLEAPLDYMAEVTPSWAASNITDPGNAYDGLAGTYATFGPSGIGQPRGDFTRTFSVNSASQGYIFVIRYLPNTAEINTDFSGSPTGVNLGLTLGLRSGAFGNPSRALRYRFPPEEINAGIREAAFLVTPDASWSGLMNAGTIEVFAAEGVRVHEMSVYVPSGDTAVRILESLKRVPTSEVAVVSEQGLAPGIGAATNPAASRTAMQVTTLAGVTVTATLERAEVSLTEDDGLRTTLYAGQAYRADDEALAAVLERLARRAVAQGGARR